MEEGPNVAGHVPNETLLELYAEGNAVLKSNVILSTNGLLPLQLYMSQYGVCGDNGALMANVFQLMGARVPEVLLASRRSGLPWSSEYSATWY